MVSFCTHPPSIIDHSSYSHLTRIILLFRFLSNDFSKSVIAVALVAVSI